MAKRRSKISRKPYLKRLKLKKTASKEPVLKESPGEEIKKIKIRVVGLGGGGGNIISEIASKIRRATFFAANTDSQALKVLKKKVSVFQFGENLTHGLGTGMNSQIAETAALAEKEKIKKILQGQDMVVLVATLGGGVGSGSTPIFAKISQGLGNLTLGIFTLPFHFEGEKKMEIAKTSLERLKPRLNAYVLLPNERVFQVVEKTTPLAQAFMTINKILADSLEGLIETIFDPGLINIDFADLKTILSGRGRLAYLNTAQVPGSEESTSEIIEKTLNSPVYPYNSKGAKAVLFNIAGKKGMSLSDVGQISKTISDLANKEAKIIFGVSRNRKNGETVKITLLATGCAFRQAPAGKKEKEKTKKAVSKPAAEKKSLKSRKGIREKLKAGFRKIISKKIKAPVKKTKTEKKSSRVPKRNIKKAKEIIKKQKETPSVQEEPQKNQPEPQEMPEDEASGEIRIRKNGLQLKREVEEEEKKMLSQEELWETPAFLRKKKIIE